MSDRLIFTVVGFHTLVAALPITVFVSYIRPALFPWCMAGFLGLLAGFVNLQTDAIQFPATLLLAFGFFAGYQIRTRLWIIPLLIAFWIPAGEYIRFALGAAPGPATYPFGPFLAFIPAVIGTAVGRGVSRYALPGAGPEKPITTESSTRRSS